MRSSQASGIIPAVQPEVFVTPQLRGATPSPKNGKKELWFVFFSPPCPGVSTPKITHKIGDMKGKLTDPTTKKGYYPNAFLTS